MGNICSRDICSRNDSDNFSGPGRVVGTTPSNANPPASVPVTNQETGRPPGSNSSNPGQKAADAALKRAKAGPTGYLGRKLSEQQAQTDKRTLEKASREKRAARDLDESLPTRNWD